MVSQSVNKQLNTYHVIGAMLRAGHRKPKQTNNQRKIQSPCPPRASILMGKTHKQMCPLEMSTEQGGGNVRRKVGRKPGKPQGTREGTKHSRPEGWLIGRLGDRRNGVCEEQPGASASGSGWRGVRCKKTGKGRRGQLMEAVQARQRILDLILEVRGPGAPRAGQCHSHTCTVEKRSTQLRSMDCIGERPEAGSPPAPTAIDQEGGVDSLQEGGGSVRETRGCL